MFFISFLISFLFSEFVFNQEELIFRTSLVVQWLGVHLSMQETWVQALVWEDHGVAKPMHHNYWAHVPQLLKPARLEPVHHNEE